MNRTSQALRGYAEHAVSTRSERRTEYEVIAKVTQTLRDSAANQKCNFAAFAEALHLNQRLWTLLVVDVVDTANGLPDELKARVLYLAEFTRVHTKRILREGASVLPLLEVNVAVLRGLKHDGPTS